LLGGLLRDGKIEKQLRAVSFGMDRRLKRKGRSNQALEQTRDSVLRYGEVVGCELLNFFVLQ